MMQDRIRELQRGIGDLAGLEEQIGLLLDMLLTEAEEKGR
jgi:hypothetical protein